MLMVQRFEWPLVDSFVDRADQLKRLETWWRSDERMPVALLGRRRVGKSWLFRRFAHGKPSVILVAEQLASGAQLDRFAAQLEPVLGVRPQLPDAATLLRVLFQAARQRKVLAVVDEFPWLLSRHSAARRRQLSTLQAVIEEERDSSRLKLIFCGSTVAQMESLFAERNPLHGRLVRQELLPLSFEESVAFGDGFGALERFERFAISGGMPRYLSSLMTGELRSTVCRQVLDRDAPLWNEGRLIVEQELVRPDIYFAILQSLATGGKALNELAQVTHIDGKLLGGYLKSLKELRLVRRQLPVGARPERSRMGHWHLDDPFLRFWFRFVFPYQADLESGLRANDLFVAEVAPALADHVSPVFEDWSRAWVRRHFGTIATQVGAWWGPALNRLRRSGERTSEEIDIVGLGRRQVTLVGECKWTNRKMSPAILQAIEEHKLPALLQAGFRGANDLKIVLLSKAGYTTALHRIAETDARITLVDVERQLSGLG